MVTVSCDVGKLVILLNVTGQVADADVRWFDDFVLYRIRWISEVANAQVRVP